MNGVMSEAATAGTMLELKAVSKRFVRKRDVAARIAGLLGANVRDETVHAVDHVSLAIQPGEVVGLVGESGCGKSTLGRLAAGLLKPDEGERRWRSRNTVELSSDEQRRAKLAVQMIFQDPYASLNPRMRVEDIVGEAPVVHGVVPRRDQRAHVAATLERVGLDPGLMRRFPHQFSGGQRARIGIARALAVNPEFLVCDEAVAALDVSIQAQVLNLFFRLREELQLTYLFISHDLGVVRHLSDRVLIMYLGRIVEAAPTEELYARPNHPYTQALLAEIPKLEARRKTFAMVKGEIPSPLDPPAGCHFHPRCPQVMPRCKVERPELREIGHGRESACHLNDP